MLAYILVIGFHSMTWLLFDIGIFPILMTLVTPIFFTPSWPYGFIFKLNLVGSGSQKHRASAPVNFSTPLKVFLVLWCSFILFFH